MTTKAAQPKRATGSGRGSDVRREAILDAATKLFSVHGFAETGIDEIGEAVGITGPAVYRYFASKQDLLGAVLDRAASQVSALPARVRAEATSPDDAVRRLVEYLVALTIEDRALTALYWHEARNLPPGPRRRIERTQRKAVDDYAVILRELRPELTDSEARMAVYAASALMRSVANRETSLDEARLHRLLSSMAYASLMHASPGSA